MYPVRVPLYMSPRGKKTAVTRSKVILGAGLLTLLLSCQEQTWESAMAAGQQAVQQGNYAEAERIYQEAVKKAEA